MDSVKFVAPSDSIPVIRNVDVAVIGGGPGGLGAAIMSARSGAKTILIERFGVVGGMAAVGEVTPFMYNHYCGEPMDKPIYMEWRAAMAAYQPESIRNDEGKQMMLNKDIAALAAEEMLQKAGVEIIYHHTLVNSVVENRKISYIILHSKSGFSAVKAKNFIDATGDADLAMLSKCEFELGDAEGYCQPMTNCFKLSHVKPPMNEEICKWDSSWRHQLNDIFLKAKADGRLSCPRENLLMFSWFDDDVTHFNTTRVIKHDPTNGESLSDAEQIAHKQIRELISVLRSDAPGFENASLQSMASTIGIRESRRVKGLKYVTREDFIKRSKFDDAILRCNYPIDIHSGKGAGTELVYMKGDEYYEIPYGAIIPKDVDNLAIAGRPISVDVAVHSSMRVMPPACSVGQAAGIAAAMSIKNNCDLPKLDGRAVRAALVAQGAFLN